MGKKNKKKQSKEKKSSNVLYYIFMFTIIIVFVLVLFSRYISTTGLTIKEYPITKNVTNSFDGLKIVQFSDIHYGSTIYEKEIKKMVNAINRLKPDLVVFTGDLLDKNTELEEKDILYITNELNRIEASIGKYYIKGECDYSIYFDAIMEQTDFIDLNNKTDLIYLNDNTPIYFIGLDDSLKGNPDYSIINNENDYYSILLIHEPDMFDIVKDKNVDLILAGHSHNGQVRLPILGAIYKIKGATKYYDEHYIISDTDIYISGGLGTNKYKFRLLNRPSINFFRFYNKEN